MNIRWVLRSIVAGCLSCAFADAATFHVAVTGNDASAGDGNFPWKTIQYCADQAQAGDVCRVHAGTYRETVTAKRSGTAAAPIRFEAAPGECATVSGADLLTGTWSVHSGSIWRVPTNRQFIQMFSGGKLLNEARWPNADPADLVHMPMAKAGAGTDLNGIVAVGAPAGDWKGAMVLVLPGLQWFSYTRHVAGYDPVSRRLSFDKPINEWVPQLVPKEDSRYFLFGSLTALDSEGEWSLDAAAGTLYFWPPASVRPDALPLEVKQRTWAFDVSNQSYVEIAGFRTFASAIRLNYASHCTVDGVRGEYVSAMRETDGWNVNPDVPTIWGDSNVWKNSVFSHSAASGLWVHGNDNLIVNNVIHDVDTAALQRAGIEFAAWGTNARNTVAYNTTFRSGWAGIALTGSNAGRTLYNLVTDSSLLVNDAGGIYAGLTDGQGSEIAWNEVARSPCEYCTGVYLDDGSKNFVVHHNYVHDIAWFGASFKNQNAFFNNSIRAVGRSPFTMGMNANTGAWDGVSSAFLLNNLLEETTGLSVSLTLATQTDYFDFIAPTSATPEWRHVGLSFSSFSQQLAANPAAFDLRGSQLIQFHVEEPGGFDLELDNVRLEGITPRLLSDFESGFGSYLGTSWWPGAASGSSATLTSGSPGVACSNGAAKLAGNQFVQGWNGLGLPLSPSSNGSVDLSGYSGVSFDVRARSSFWISAQGTPPIEPIQGFNFACPVDAFQVPTTSCAIGKAQAIAGYVAAGSDLGAFPSGSRRWTAGAQFSEDPASCIPPRDVVMGLPPAAPYPATPAGQAAAFPLDAAWSDPPCTPNSTSLFVPVVLSLAGKNGSFYTSELTLMNRGPSSVQVSYEYTAFAGAGSGKSTSPETLGTGVQMVIPDVIGYLRGKGVPIPLDGSFGGTLQVTYQGVSAPGDAVAIVRTTTPVPPLAPEGAAGLAYTGLAPSDLLSIPVYIAGLRQTGTDRSAVALQNAGGATDGDVTLRISLFAGDGSTSAPVATIDQTLSPGGFAQPSLPDLGSANGTFYALVERLSGSASYNAYGVINDNGTNDGSFVSPVSAFALSRSIGITIPVVVEAASYSTEVILTNTAASQRQLQLTYSAAAIQGGSSSVDLQLGPGKQVIIPAFVQYLRQQGTPGIGPTGGSFAGPLFVTGNTDGIIASARTWNPDPSGAGRYGLFYGGVSYGTAAVNAAWLFGLQQTARSRSNLALVNTGEVDGSADTFVVELFSGETGQKLGQVTQLVGARGFIQLGQVLTLVPGNASGGFARISRTSGNNPFIAYGVINDGANPGERSGDGAFVAMVPE
jgi:hypothetical protein